MKISQMIERLERLKIELGDIDIRRADGSEFSVIVIDKLHPTRGGWVQERQEPIEEDHAA